MSDWDAYSASKLETLLRERELLKQRYQGLTLHPNNRLAKDAFMTWLVINGIVEDLQARAKEAA